MIYQKQETESYSAKSQPSSHNRIGRQTRSAVLCILALITVLIVTVLFPFFGWCGRWVDVHLTDHQASNVADAAAAVILLTQPPQLITIN